ncbi:F0F1 ATP synthase subunit B [Buchnera aphidicola]|nr:F0F1 ATP synthase subunit B [Buchnera aphidicola]
MNINATIIGQTISFILFIWICMKYIWPPIMDTINERQKTIIKSLQLANQAKIEYEKIQKKIQITLENTKKEAVLIIHKAQKKQEKIISQTKIKAKKESFIILNETKKIIEMEKKKMISESKKHIVKLSIQIAEKLLQHSINKKDNDKLIKTLLTNI